MKKSDNVVLSKSLISEVKKSDSLLLLKSPISLDGDNASSLIKSSQSVVPISKEMRTLSTNKVKNEILILLLKDYDT